MASNATATATATAVHSSNTTFVQADPSTFRAVVQKLTGAPNDPSSSQRLPRSFQTRTSCPKRPAFRLHERRQSSKKLELELNSNSTAGGAWPRGMGMVSPVSTLEFLARGSPATTPISPSEEEEKAIAEKGFFLHPSPMSTPRGSDPPELLTLFPLQSPRDCNSNDSSSSSLSS